MQTPLPEGEAPRLLHLMFRDNLEVACMLLDLDGRVAWWSAGAECIFGYSPAQIVGRSCDVLFVEEDAALGIPENERQVARRGATAEDDRYMRRADGSRFWAAGSLRAIHDEAGRCVGFGKILRNRTDLRGQIDTLRNRLAETEGGSRAKDVFLATLSHELRNPLAPLSNAVHLLRRALPPSGEAEFALKIVERQIAQLQRLVDDILDVSRVGAGKIEIERRPLDLTEVLRQAVEACDVAMRKRGHRLELVVPEGPLAFLGDPQRMQQVFANLLNNAIKYTPEGGHVWVKATTEGDEVVAHIEDDGEGIAPEVLPRIFDLFTQAESARSEGGLGLGLALVKDLVTLHGGSVQARSDGPGKGSVFTVRLPRAA